MYVSLENSLLFASNIYIDVFVEGVRRWIFVQFISKIHSTLQFDYLIFKALFNISVLLHFISLITFDFSLLHNLDLIMCLFIENVFFYECYLISCLISYWQVDFLYRENFINSFDITLQRSICILFFLINHREKV